MNCPRCASTTPKEQTKKTSLGYRTVRCSTCRRTFHERTGTPFNFLEYPTDIVLLVVLWRLRYTLSLRDLAEMFLERGLEFMHEAVREWEACFAPLLADHLRPGDQGKRDAPGTWMKRTSTSKGNGVLCIEPSIGIATW